MRCQPHTPNFPCGFDDDGFIALVSALGKIRPATSHLRHYLGFSEQGLGTRKSTGDQSVATS
jgi:hypothetical protein